MSATQANCLINQDACGREAGNPVCLKCGIDDRVVYPGQGDLEVALERAELKYWKAHAQELQGRLDDTGKLPEPTQPLRSGPHAVGQVFRDAPWAPEMVVLPSGKFLMGSPQDEPGRSYDESPQHEVTIGYQFAMGKYPVTNEEWDASVASGFIDHKLADRRSRLAKYPVDDVNWNRIQQYVAWLNNKLGIVDDDPTRYRLPSEAEWEYACRAGTTGMYNTPDGLLTDERANYNASYTFAGAPLVGRKLKTLTPVGSYRSNPWGLYDMHGNVWEWVQDNYEDSYLGAPQDGSSRMTGSSRHVLRGGSLDFNPQFLRSAYRYRSTPNSRNGHFGFRLARTLP